ncbi:MAG TPA: carbohydrate ABC transporter permease [Chloroflexota bacterium]|nr:carbohydrate ABC transporter permease [Chloroflexota bacterium]
MATGELARLGVRSTAGPRRRPVPVGTIVRHVVLVAFMLVILVPLAWVLLLSIKSIPDAYRPGFWPQHFDFTHYTYALTNIPTLPRNMLNSVFVTLSTVVITTICAVLGGYALVHLRLRGRAVVLGLLVASLFFPTRVTSLIAIFETQRALGLINTTAGLILPYITLNLALSVFIMRGIFEQISHELVDAASIDGAGPWRTLLSVLLPLTRNGIVVVIIVNFVSAWGEYLLGVTLTNDQEVRTLPVVLAGAFGGMGQWAWPRIAAVYVIAIAPGLAAFALSQRWYMQGLQEGALKY